MSEKKGACYVGTKKFRADDTGFSNSLEITFCCETLKKRANQGTGIIEVSIEEEMVKIAYEQIFFCPYCGAEVVCEANEK